MSLCPTFRTSGLCGYKVKYGEFKYTYLFLLLVQAIDVKLTYKSPILIIAPKLSIASVYARDTQLFNAHLEWPPCNYRTL